jgi:hypothetical protein
MMVRVWGREAGLADTARAKFPTAGPMVSDEEPQALNTRVTTPERRPRRARVPIDEMMVMFKGFYCPIRQYMPKKLEK